MYWCNMSYVVYSVVVVVVVVVVVLFFVPWRVSVIFVRCVGFFDEQSPLVHCSLLFLALLLFCCSFRCCYCLLVVGDVGVGVVFGVFNITGDHS